MSPMMLDHTSSDDSTNKRKTFRVTPAKPNDVRRLVDIEFHAFENERVNQVLSYRDYKKPAHFERSVKIYQQALNSAQSPQANKRRLSGSMVHAESNSDTVSFRKVVDSKTQELISFTKYEMKQYTEDELASPADIGHEGEPKMNRDWFALNERLRREYIGTQKHCYIGMLATEPRHQHNGAGTLLLEQVLAEADDAGVETYLEATDTAKPFYERHGFEIITELRFDPAGYGVKGLGVERQTVMVRGALGRTGERGSARGWEDAVKTKRE
ncbi:uncharacterized protein LTR77_003559 [Saxophila tyrrhenica]|uniref:N-acetyltransferase domain-containing protein n=1 Tax=Saxophila tyrrhenica TaxID=1690608 RepID=A0AAV9PFC0_9PEZI|nr:hypothetical protein LTR77_003559 [Saxophila tyrrhenica]